MDSPASLGIGPRFPGRSCSLRDRVRRFSEEVLRLTYRISHSGFKDDHENGDQSEEEGSPPCSAGQFGFAVNDGDKGTEGDPDDHLDEDPQRPSVAEARKQAKAAEQDEEQADTAGDRAELAQSFIGGIGNGADNEAAVAEENHKNAQKVEDLINLCSHTGRKRAKNSEMKRRIH